MASPPSHALNVAFAIVPKIPSVLSILGSSLIIYDAAYRQLRLQDQPWRGLVPMLMDFLQRRRSGLGVGGGGSAAAQAAGAGSTRNSSNSMASRKGSYVASANVRYHTYHRLLLSMSIFDVLSSCALFMSTWPIPADTPSKIVYGAVGNQATCSAQGFFVQFSMGTVLYNATLSVFYLLSIRFRWSPQRVAKKAEPWLHAVPVLFALGTAIAGVPLGLYNYARFMCYIVAKPFKCQETWKFGDDPEKPCQRGDNATVYNWAFNILPKAAVLIVVTLIMWLCHRHVLRLERRFTKGPSSDSSVNRRSSQSSRRSREYDEEDGDKEGKRNIEDEFQDDEAARPAGSGKKGASMSKRIARQSFLYVGALYLTLLPGIVNRLTELIAGKRFAAVAMTIALLMPAQGFWNCFIYFRPRYLQVKRRQRRSREKEERERIVQAMRSENGNVHGGQHLEQPPEALPPTHTNTSGAAAVIQAVSAALFDNDLDTDDAVDDEEVQRKDDDKDQARVGDVKFKSENTAIVDLDKRCHDSSTRPNKSEADVILETTSIDLPGIDR